MLRINPIEIFDSMQQIPKVDDWVCPPEDEIFKTIRNAIILDVSKYYDLPQDSPIDYFMTNSKRGYDSDALRGHCIHYLNYFEKFYDYDKELISIYANMKYLMDFIPEYSETMFKNDLMRYIINGNIFTKLSCMNEYNYSLELTYKNKNNEVLQYDNKHGKMLMLISITILTLIPLITHFIYVNKIININDFILSIYNNVLEKFNSGPNPVDLVSKIYETSLSNIVRNKKSHAGLWAKQDIRGINVTTHSMNSVLNIIINIIPKYVYNQNIIHYNYEAIRCHSKYQVTDIAYEYNFVPLSTSNRDEDGNSDFDRFESYLTKADESLYLLNKVSSDQTMKNIELVFGPFDDKEIDFYIKELSKNNGQVITQFQKELLFYIFYQYFTDTITINAINKRDYIKLMITARKILLANGLVILPYVISGKPVRLFARKNISKKELDKIKASDIYTKIVDKYKNPDIVNKILTIIAGLLSSEFNIISYDDESLNGRPIEMISDIISEEVLIYVSLI